MDWRAKATGGPRVPFPVQAGTLCCLIHIISYTVYGNALSVGMVCLWGRFVCGNGLSVGMLCLWERFVGGNALSVGTL